MSSSLWFPKFSQLIKWLGSCPRISFGPYSSALVAITFIAGTAIYIYPEPFKRRFLILANQMTNLYLDYKYRNYDHNRDANGEIHKPYTLTKLKLISIKNPSNIFELPIENQSFLKGTSDLRSGKLTIDCNKIFDSFKNNYEFDDQTLLYIYFVYNQNEYILPYKFTQNAQIEFPIYVVEDIDSCFMIEYETASTKNRSSDDESDSLLTLINKFAGPKGNFYSDTQHIIKPEYLICDRTLRSLLSFDDDDYLKLSSSMGNDYQFARGEKITVDIGL